MDKRDRIDATVTGDAVDRPPVALWRHFPGDDQSPDDLAAATLSFQSTWDWDLVKITPASSFCLRDWGVEDEWVGGDEGTREYRRRPVTAPADWHRLAVLDPHTGRLGEQLRCVDLVAQGLGGRVPVIQTVFSPLAQARNLAGAERLIEQLRERPDDVRAGLETITRTAIAFVRGCAELGIDGIYYAIQLASPGQLTSEEYRTFGEPFDLRILDAGGSFRFNMLHIHGTNVMFDLLSAYPVQAVNWHDRETHPSLGEGMRQVRGAVCGGLARWDDLLRGDPDRIRVRIADAVRQTGGRRLILSSGCVAPVTTPLRNLRAVRTAVETPF